MNCTGWYSFITKVSFSEFTADMAAAQCLLLSIKSEGVEPKTNTVRMMTVYVLCKSMFVFTDLFELWAKPQDG